MLLDTGVDIRWRLDHNSLVATRDTRWENIAGRIDWVLENRPELKSMRQWSLQAGLSHAAVKGIHQRNGGMNSTTAGPLARVARVSVDWLMSGDGSPERIQQSEHLIEFPDGADPWRKRALASKMARKSDIPDEFLDRVARAARFNTVEFQYKSSAQWHAIFLQEWLDEIRNNPSALMGGLQARKAKRERAAEKNREESAPESATTAPASVRRHGTDG